MREKPMKNIVAERMRVYLKTLNKPHRFSVRSFYSHKGDYSHVEISYPHSLTKREVEKINTECRKYRRVHDFSSREDNSVVKNKKLWVNSCTFTLTHSR